MKTKTKKAASKVIRTKVESNRPRTMMEQLVVEFLATHGPQTLAAIQKEFGGNKTKIIPQLLNGLRGTVEKGAGGRWRLARNPSRIAVPKVFGRERMFAEFLATGGLHPETLLRDVEEAARNYPSATEFEREDLLCNLYLLLEEYGDNLSLQDLFAVLVARDKRWMALSAAQPKKQAQSKSKAKGGRTAA